MTAATIDWFDSAPRRISANTEAARWARSGALGLTGAPGEAPWVPGGVTATRLAWLAGELRRLSAMAGSAVEIDGPALLGERAAITGMTRQGSTSVGGSAQMVEAADRWLALNLARPDDSAVLSAWLGIDVDRGDWTAIRTAIRLRRCEELVERAALVGLPVAAVAEHGGGSPSAAVRIDRLGTSVRQREVGGRPLVLELASLWAGPLCGSLLALAGFDVVKVEHPRRPDGARRGPAAFFDLLNAGKRSIGLDLSDRSDRAVFDRLVSRSAAVIDGSRPRVATNLGIEVERLVDSGTIWLSITGHGRTGAGANRVAFGDDAAVAGGLVIPSIGDRPPMFVADAAADPIAGLVGAVAVLNAWVERRAALVDLSMAAAVAWTRGPHPGAPNARQGGPDAPNARARVARGRASGLDADRSWVIDDLEAVERAERTGQACKHDN